MERWDAYDRDGNLLGYDLVRGEEAPTDAWHKTVGIYPVTEDGRMLVTRRHPEKPFGLQWEVTGGAVCKGEDEVQGAVRELLEETGLVIRAEQLIRIGVEDRENPRGYNTLYHTFLTFFDPSRQSIRMQEGETVEYRLMPYEEFCEFVLTEAYVESLRERFLEDKPVVDRLIREHLMQRE